jgi:hypothetical protein
VKGAVLAVLVVIVLMTGLPVVVAVHSMPACPSCDEAVPTWPLCLAVLPAALVLAALWWSRVRAAVGIRPSLLHLVVPEPPPRTA